MEREEMALKAQRGNRAALFQLWDTVKPLLFSMAWKFYIHQGNRRCFSHGVTFEDLKQESFLAFADAVKAYKPKKGYLFTSYLSYATDNRFKACMGIKSKLDALNYADRLERQMDDDEESGSVGDLIQDEKAAAALSGIDDKLERETASGILSFALDSLPELQREVLKHRFFYLHTVKETANSLCVTPQDVRREESRGLQTLRKNPDVCTLGSELLQVEIFWGIGMDIQDGVGGADIEEGKAFLEAALEEVGIFL